jgi:hypothetical protein
MEALRTRFLEIDANDYVNDGSQKEIGSPEMDRDTRSSGI